MALIDKDATVVAVRDAFKPNTTRAIRGMYAIKQLEEVEAIPKETVRAALEKAGEVGYDLGDYTEIGGETLYIPNGIAIEAVNLIAKRLDEEQSKIEAEIKAM